MKPTKLFGLGAMMEIGKTCIVVEHDQDIVVIDAGIKFTNSMETGVDGIIPDYSYLAENQDRVRGLFITHGHEDHIGGIPYLISQVDIPIIVAPTLAIALIQSRLKEKKIKYKGEFVPLEEDAVFQYNDLKVDFWTTQHSIPDSFGIRITTPNGVFADTGDFRFDYSPIGNLTNFGKLEKIGKEGVDILMSDSTNALSMSHSPSESVMMADIERVIKNSKGKVVLTTFASNVYRVHAVIELAVKYNRKVCVFGRSMVKGVDIARKLGHINVPESMFVDKRDLSKLPDKEVFVVSTGSQGEERAFLARLAHGKQDWLRIGKGDTVIFSSSPIPGNVMQIEQLINQLYKLNVDILEHKIDGHFHTSGHAYKDEHKKMFELIKPKYFLPFHGSYRQSAVHGVTAVECGVKEENVIMAFNGEVLYLEDHKVRVSNEFVDPGPIYIDSGVFNKTTGHAIKVREELGRNGFINVVVTINKKKNEIVGRTKIISRGALYVKNSYEIIQDIQKRAHGSILYTIKNNPNWTKADIKKIVKERISPYFYKLKRRNPLIITSIIELDKSKKLTNVKRKGKPENRKPAAKKPADRKPTTNKQDVKKT